MNTKEKPKRRAPINLDDAPTFRDQYPGGRKQRTEEQQAEQRENNPTEAQKIEKRVEEINAELRDLRDDTKNPLFSKLFMERIELQGRLAEMEAQRMLDTGDYISASDRLQALMRQEAAQWAKTHLATRDLELPPALDINDLEDDDADYLVDGYLQLGTTGFVSAKYGAGKSFLVLDWACSIATGRKWLEHETTMGHVIYVAAEGAGGQSKRAQAWVQTHEPVPRGTVTLLQKPIQLGNTQHVDHLVELTKNTKASLVIIDTLARSMVGLDESKDGAIITAALDRIRDAWGERQTTVLVVHHFGKDASRGVRGDSRFIADADFSFTMDKDPITGCVVLHCEKLKDDEPPPDIGLRLRKVQLDKWGKRTSCVLYGVDLLGDDDELVNYIRKNPRLGSGEISKARGGNRSNMSTRLTELQRQGRIRDEDTRKNRNSWRDNHSQ